MKNGRQDRIAETLTINTEQRMTFCSLFCDCLLNFEEALSIFILFAAIALHY